MWISVNRNGTPFEKALDKTNSSCTFRGTEIDAYRYKENTFLKIIKMNYLQEAATFQFFDGLDI